MSFGSFIRGIAAQVNPFDRGKTYGSYNPPQRRRRPEDEPGYQAPRIQAPNQNQQQQQQQNRPQVQRPEDFFQGLNNNLRIPGAPQNNVAVPTRPKQPSFWDKVRDTAVGTVANIPEVGLAAGRTATGILQGAAHLPSLATHALTYAPRRIAGNDSAINRGLSTVNRGVDTATSVVDKPFNFVNRRLDTAAKSYEQQIYKDYYQ